MNLSIRKTISLTRTEKTTFEQWAQAFLDRAETVEQGEANLRRAMNRKYGSPQYCLTGSNDTFTLNLGFSPK